MESSRTILQPLDILTPARPGPRTWLGFLAMALGLFMAILDMQIVATSLPTIQASLGIDPQRMSWIQTAYIIAEVVTIPITGFLTRALTMRGLFVAGVTIFAVASAGCAASRGFDQLIAWRIVQGFAAGTMVPAVFSAVFLLFPGRLEAFATAIAGIVAVLAPTLGPTVGGYITQTYSWHWLFLINLAPALAAAVTGFICLPRGVARPGLLRQLDVAGLASLGLALTGLVVALKLAPDDGWGSAGVVSMLALTVIAAAVFVRRAKVAAEPAADLSPLSDPRVIAGCALNFLFGIAFFATMYLLPLFLALVRGHNALEIGRIMLVTGIAQLVTAPVAVLLEKRIDPKVLSLLGFLLFGWGLMLSGYATGDTDYDAMFVPQVIRGIAVMFCILPPTRLALGHLPLAEIPNASGLFNVTRNLGGAIGLALVDTVIFGRAPIWGAWIAERLRAGDVGVAQAVGIPLDEFLAARGQPIDADTREILQPMVERLALVQAVNEAWLMLAAITVVGASTIVAALLLVKRGQRRAAIRSVVE